MKSCNIAEIKVTSFRALPQFHSGFRDFKIVDSRNEGYSFQGIVGTAEGGTNSKTCFALPTETGMNLIDLHRCLRLVCEKEDACKRDGGLL